MKKILFVILLCCVVSLSNSVKAQIPENLDELFARKTRLASATWGAGYLEDPVSYIWQCEALCYYDIQTGREVWRMTTTPNLINYYHNDIGVSPWSADGKIMAFCAWDRFTQAYSQSQQEEWHYLGFIVNTNGSNMRPTVEASGRLAEAYFHWSPQIPNVYYGVGETHLSSGAQTNILYKNSLDDSNVITRTPLVLNLGSAAGGKINKMISPDGKKVILEQNSIYYPLTVYPESDAGFDDDGFSMDRHFGNYGNSQPDDTVSNYHDQYIGGDGSWYFGMPSNHHATWWRIKTLGSDTDGGALYTDDLIPPTDEAPYDFGECWPENHGSISVAGNLSSPFVQDNPYTPDKCGYWSHFVPDRWGRYALFSSVVDGLPLGYGPGVWDIQLHEYNVSSFGGNAQHHDWHGFTDWTVSSRGTGGETNYLNDRLYSQKYDNQTSQVTVCYTHTLYNSGGVYGGADAEYYALTRPAQSPDGTKIAFHSTFLNETNNPDIYWAVAYYPYPPTDLEASYNSGVQLSFLPPKYTERGWPYADPNPEKDSLGWPLLNGEGNEIGETLYAREIKQYHVWRALSQSGPWQEIGTVEAQYSYTYADAGFEDYFMLHPISGGFKVSPSNKISLVDTIGDGTYYYALTSEEHSGLESDSLSEIIRVIVSGSSISDQSIVAPKGQTDFWTTPPPTPSNFSCQATGVTGHNRLTWDEPVGDKIRYYNIYYASGSDPSAEQAYRIASLPVGTNTYLDWLAEGNARYLITSVDRYGNESVAASGINKPEDLPGRLNLNQNLPNPFTEKTVISYHVAAQGKLTLKIYDITGKKIITLVNEEKTTGTHTVQWDGTDSQGKRVPSGTYFYQIRWENRDASAKKMIFLK